MEDLDVLDTLITLDKGLGQMGLVTLSDEDHAVVAALEEWVEEFE